VSASTSKRPAPDDPTGSTPRKSHRSAANNEAANDEQAPNLIPTSVENEHEILGDCPSLESIRSDTSDWSKPETPTAQPDFTQSRAVITSFYVHLCSTASTGMGSRWRSHAHS